MMDYATLTDRMRALLVELLRDGATEALLVHASVGNGLVRRGLAYWGGQSEEPPWRPRRDLWIDLTPLGEDVARQIVADAREARRRPR